MRENEKVDLEGRELIVDEGYKAVLYEDGEYVKTMKPGRYNFKRNTAEVFIDLVTFQKPAKREVVFVDVREKAIVVSGQEILTLDRIPVRVTVAVQYRVEEPARAINEVENYRDKLYQEVQMYVRDFVASLNLDSVLANKGRIGKAIEKEVSKKLDVVGVEVISAGLKDIILPGDIRSYMNKVIIADREAKAKLITAREEVASARALANAAKIMSTNKNIMALKRIEVLKEIAKNPANKIYFGIGDELFEDFVRSRKRK